MLAEEGRQLSRNEPIRGVHHGSVTDIAGTTAERREDWK